MVSKPLINYAPQRNREHGGAEKRNYDKPCEPLLILPYGSTRISRQVNEFITRFSMRCRRDLDGSEGIPNYVQEFNSGLARLLRYDQSLHVAEYR